ncbi:MAG: hypothetical protein K2J13_03745, partial [Clostridia bacterium]|nr:hypothetical protein [Clostridia bacterium]
MAYDKSKNSLGAEALAGTSDPGKVDGVINSWTGTANGYSRWATYSPIGRDGNFSVTGIIVGFSGEEYTRDGGTDKNTLDKCQPSNIETVSNIYSCIGDIYTDSANCTIGHSFAVKSGDVYAPRKLFNEIKITRRMDRETSSSTAPAQEAYATWESTDEQSGLLTVVDITDNEDHILWSDSVRKYNAGVEIENLRNTYFNLSETLADARNDYKITSTSLKRGAYQKIEFNYVLGRAVYVKQVLANNSAMTGTEEFSAIQYGNELDVPKIELYTNSDYSGSPVETIDPNTYSYWKTLKEGSNSLDPANGIKPLGTYTSFIYLNDAADGTKYTSIHMFDSAYHYVAYIKDDKIFQKYVEDHPGYSHVDLKGAKNYDWQPRVQQSVVAKKISFTIDPPNIGIDVNGVREVEYQGTTISYSASVRDEIETETGEKTIITVTADLEYYKTDSNFDEDNMELIPEGAKDSGYYIVRAVSLNNSNYEIDQVEDRRLYIKKKLTFVFFDETKVTEVNDEYHLNIEYNGDEQEIQGAPSKDSLSLEEMARRNLTFCVYNINEGDENMLQIASYGIDDGDYDEIFATNVSAKDEDGNYIGSYKVQISFTGGQAASNYSLPEITTFVVTIVPATVDWENPVKK